MPCKICFEKGFPCGINEKVWGRRRQMLNNPTQTRREPIETDSDETYRAESTELEEIPRTPGTPNDDILTSDDALFLEYGWRNIYLTGPNSHQGPVSRIASWILRRYGEKLSSRAVRHAFLALACCYRNTRADPRVSMHLTSCYRYTQEAISSQNYADIVYSCYFMIWARCTNISDLQDFDEGMAHLSGFMICLQQLATSPSLNFEELVLMKLIWYDIYRTLNRWHTHRCNAKFRNEKKIGAASIELNRLSVAWSEIHLVSRSKPAWLHHLIRGMQLDSPAFELQESLDEWYSVDVDDKAEIASSPLPCAIDNMQSQLTLLRNTLSQYRGLFPSLIYIPELEMHHSDELESMSVMYNIFLFEYVLLVEPFTTSSLNRKNAIITVGKIVDNIHSHLESATAVVPLNSLWLLFLIGLLLGQLENYSGTI